MSGDPRRCPECGYLNPMGELELTAAAVVGWIVGAANFHRFCLGKEGWVAALLKYHIYAQAMIGAVIGAFVGWQGLMSMMFGPLSARTMPALDALLTLAFTAGLIVAIRWLLPTFHRRFRADTLFLRREITIVIARDQIRNQLRRGRR